MSIFIRSRRWRGRGARTLAATSHLPVTSHDFELFNVCCVLVATWPRRAERYVV